MATGLAPQRRRGRARWAAPGVERRGREGSREGAARGAAGRPCRRHGSMAFHEDRARRPPQERQDLAVQPPHRRERRDLVASARARGEMHAGVARVPDARVDRLTALFKPKKTTLATFEVVDLAGIAKGEREGLDAKEFRNADALLHVVRAFADAARRRARSATATSSISRPELILADLEVVERRLERLEAQIKKKRDGRRRAGAGGAPTAQARARSPRRRSGPMALTDDEARSLRGFTFLSQKPILHCLNLAEKEIAQAETLAESFGLGDVAARPRTPRGLGLRGHRGGGRPARRRRAAGASSPISASPSRRSAACSRDCYALLGLVSFFTVGEDEVRAWSDPARHPRPGRGRRHPLRHRARLHPRRGRGLRRADRRRRARWPTVRERGQFRLEGKDYVVRTARSATSASTSRSSVARAVLIRMAWLIRWQSAGRACSPRSWVCASWRGSAWRLAGSSVPRGLASSSGAPS